MVRATPGLNVDTQLSTATEQQINSLQGNCGDHAGNLAPPPLTFDQFRVRGFDVDWCQYLLVEFPDSTVTAASQAPPTTDIATPTQEERNYILIIIVVLVCVLIFVTVCALGCIFFSSRKQS